MSSSQAKAKPKELPSCDSATVRKQISDAIVNLTYQTPFFGIFLLNTRIYETDKFPTAATDGVSIFYNKDFMGNLTQQERTGVMMHEILHMVYSHCARKRSQGKCQSTWNAALDYVINLEIKDMATPSVKLPDMVLLDEKYRGMYPEQVYELLKKKHKCGGGKPGDPAGCPGDGQGAMDEHLPMPEDAKTQQEIEDRIMSAAETAKMAGNLPRNISRLVDDIKASKVPWQRLFARYLGQRLMAGDYSYSQFNRRYLADELYLPAMKSYQLGKIAVVVDTSGSITGELMSQFAAEIKKMSNMISEIAVISCDAVVNSFEVITDCAGIEKAVQFKGGGGTDFRPPFIELKNRRFDPEVFIYLTDAQGPFPEKAPGFPCIFVITPGSDAPTPKWGIRVQMQNQ
jgi:predicted metal-dependent peptidase